MKRIEGKEQLHNPRLHGINRYSLAGKTALITGASRGIGRAIAVTFAQNGSNLVLLSRDKDRLQLIQEEIYLQNENINCQIIACDLKESSNLIEELEANFDKTGPEIFIHSAGNFALDGAYKKNRKIWNDTLAIHLTAAYELSCYLSQFMIKKKWGRIVNISSTSANGEAYALSYSVAKAGLLGLTQSLALELAKYGVTVNAVCPSWVETEMSLNQLSDLEWCRLNNIAVNDSVEIARLSSPQERILSADEIAHLTAFLCSEEAQGITGQSIKICGGLSL